ncbi:hypothetical protein LOTGIDRAFT_232761 [Lottia gigantea]|uniref:Nuclease HARBI1 n=1 Tax=Lottia gigantea TaxID=225164 RepID=V4AE31_LOTGI|nr:hypothetical protein LOTGIDRAFT_232761 [Lottia gigantea]ESO93360.1 hypothetical protein LOTGIDRAFT_232761 [Lottia gigantea]
MDDEQIVCRYRLSRPMILDLCRMFQTALARPTARSRAFPVSFQIMVALIFYATGSFQMVNADVHNISRPSVSKITRDVTACLKRVCNDYIKMPTDQAGLRNIMRGFHEKTDFPSLVVNVITYDSHKSISAKLCYHTIDSKLTHPRKIDEDIMREKRSKDDDNSKCCNGVLGYASNQAQMPVTCPDMKCCNQSETVAVVPIEDAFGFRFRCLPKTRIRPVCYQPGTEVRSSNQDADHIPRACCEGAKFEIELNKWYAAMSVKCVLR